MNALIVLASVLVSCNADGSYDSKGYGRYDDGGYGGEYGGLGGGFGGGLGGGLGGGGFLGGGLLGGGVGGVGGGGGGLGGGLGGGSFGGGLGGGFYGGVKYGTCPWPGETDFQQMGPKCSVDDNCHGSQKCCWNWYYGRRCQIPNQYQKPGRCNNFLMKPPHHYPRRACNDDTLCPGSGKCCRRYSSGQLDTCTFYSYPAQSHSYPATGGSGGSFDPVGGSFGPGGGSFGPGGGSGVVSPLLPVLPQGSFKKKY